MGTRPRSWEIVCRVVDNYGDAGVAWRLARQLAVEHGARTTLWIDDPAPLARLVPGIGPERGGTVDGVEVRRGPDPNAPWVPPDVIVDAFNVGLPVAWIDAIAASPRPPAWLVLEYLSAEAWVEDAHLRASPEPRTGIVRRYWCPGFTPRTGALLRESDLLARRDAFARGETLRTLGVDVRSGARIVLVFCYPTPALVDLLDAWAEDDAPTIALVPEGVAVDALDRYCAGAVPHPGAPFTRGALTIASIPFVPQRDFDALLWSCDAAIVRGEDSFVRAQWAALPFAWHAYAQDADAHLAKLDAFCDRYLDGAPQEHAAAVRVFNDALNRGRGTALAAAWPGFARAVSGLASHRQAWAARLGAQRDLASGLARHVADTL